MLYGLVWFVLVLALWWAALTVALPLTLTLLVSQRARSIWFSWVFVNVCGYIGLPLVRPMRKKAFQILKDHLNRRNASKPLEVLEIGVGEGLNLEYYPENCNLTVLDKSKDFESYFKKRAKKYPHVTYKDFVVQDAQDMSRIEDNSMDVVVSTYLHCYLSDPAAVLREVKRVLKPGGKYLFFEHVRYPPNDILGTVVQKFIRPLNYLVSNGCTLDRDTATTIRMAGFADVFIEDVTFDDFLIFLYKHQIIGVATK